MRTQRHLRFLIPATLLAALACGTSDAGSDSGRDAVTTDMPGMDMSGPGDVTLPTCADFCAQVADACGGANAQWADAASCAAECATWPEGTPGAMAGNSLACRSGHLAEIQDGSESPETHCAHVGPTGGGSCGTLCDAYCSLVLEHCVGTNQVYASDPECRTACALLPATGSEGDSTGDTVQCRIYHAEAAGADPVTHCSHTRADSAVCR
jgi:hypothetical protein